MKTSNWEDWAIGLSLVAAVSVGMAMHEVRAPSFAPEAVAAEPADYVMTITAKRLPAECKGSAWHAVPAYCTALRNEGTISVR